MNAPALHQRFYAHILGHGLQRLTHGGKNSKGLRDVGSWCAPTSSNPARSQMKRVADAISHLHFKASSKPSRTNYFQRTHDPRLPPCWPRWGPPGANIPHTFRILPPRPEAHQAAPDGVAADKLQTLAKRMKKSSDARGASPWCRPNISNPARSQARPRATLSCRSRHLHPLTGERQRGMPRGSLRERPNVLARDAREHVFASFSYDNGPADSAGVVRHWPALDTTRRVIPSLAVRSRRRRRGRPLARRHARAAAPVSPAAILAAPAPPRLASPLLSL